jgi:hypothetical protein
MDITQYIQGRRSMGVSDAQIRQELLANGWQPAMVDQAFMQLSAPAAAVLPQPFAEQPTAAPKKRRFGKKLIILLVLMVLTGATWAIMFLTQPGKKAVNTTTNKATTKTGQSALKQNQSDVAQENNVMGLVSKLTNYRSTHNGALPGTISVKDTHTLQLCDAQCSTASAATITLDFDISGVELHSYGDKLEAPNSQAIYVVPSANCNQDKTGVVQSPSSLSFAVLYLVGSGNNAKQACVSN